MTTSVPLLKEEQVQWLLTLAYLLEAVDENTSKTITSLVRTIRPTVLSTTAVRGTKLAALKQAVTLQAEMSAASQPVGSVAAYKVRSGKYIAVIEFLFQLEDLVTQLQKELPGIIKTKETKAGKPVAGAEPEPANPVPEPGVKPGSDKPKPAEEEETPTEPTLETILGLELHNLQIRVMNLLQGKTNLAKDVQTLLFKKVVGNLEAKRYAILNPALSTALTKQLAKITVPELTEFLTKLGPVVQRIKQVRISIGASNREEILFKLLGIPPKLNKEVTGAP